MACNLECNLSSPLHLELQAGETAGHCFCSQERVVFDEQRAQVPGCGHNPPVHSDSHPAA